MTDRDDHSGDAWPYYGKGLVEQMQDMQRATSEALKSIKLPPVFDYEPPRAETGIALLMQEAVKAHARRVESALANNPGRTPVLRTRYDEETRTIISTWEALEPKP